MVRIIIDNNNSYKLEGNLKALIKIQKHFKRKHPSAFYVRAYMPAGWDGCIDYVTETMRFKPGLLQQVVDFIGTLKQNIEIEDNRPMKLPIPVMPKMVGKFELRDKQKGAVKNLIYNKVCGMPHYIGVQDVSTNFGKTLVMGAIFHAFRQKVPTIILLKDGDLFEQFRKELPEMIDKKLLGFVRGKEINFNMVTVAMVQTLAPKVKAYTNQLAKFGIALVDEADEGDSKQYKTIITRLFNCSVRCGLSGTIYMSKLKKDEMKNMNLKTFFGEVLTTVTKKEMVEDGFSTRPVIRIHKGSELPKQDSYPEEYKINISQNKARAKIGAELMKKAIRFKRTPALVIYRFHEHGELLLKVYRKAIPNKRIELAHGDTKKRKVYLEEFRVGKIDILISSFIIKRGKNHPLIKYIQNASATDSEETLSQVGGRGERTDKSKSKFYLDDFYDEGSYLKRHSKHRIIYYKKWGFPVKIMF